MKNLILVVVFITIGVFTCAQNSYFSFEQALNNDNVRSIEEDAVGNVWIGTIDGITKFDGEDFVSYTTADGLGGNVVYDILAHSSGDIYAATSGGLSVFDGASWSNITMGDGLPSNTIWSIEEDNLNQVWVGTSDIGVAFFNGTDWHVLGTGDGLIANGVKVIFADRNDNIWFGTGNGVSVYDGSVFKNFNTSTGLPGSLVNDITQLYNGNVAVATNGGIGIYNFHSWTSITTTEGLPTANILALREDYNQNLWMGASVGLIKYDWSSFTVFDYDDGLTSNIVSKLIITHAGDNKIWAGSPFNGVSVFDSDDDFIIYRTNKNLVSDNVTTIFTDSQDVTWVGTANGLNRVDDLNWRTYTIEQGLTDNNITAIHEDLNGDIWVGTSNGLNVLDGDSFVQITLADGLTNGYINSITSDPGSLYVATQDKVTVISGGVVVDTLDVTDGLFADEVKQIHFEGGRLWFVQDTSVQYFNGAFVDVTMGICGVQPTLSGAKSLNGATGQYFGVDNTLRYFDGGIEMMPCNSNPFATGGTMTSIVEFGPNIYCNFDDGTVMMTNGGPWMPFPIPFPVSFIEQSFDENYLWVGGVNGGLGKVCMNYSSQVTYTSTVPTCHETADGIVSVSSPVGSEYSIDYGETWQGSGAFVSENGGYKHILVRNASQEIIADSIIYLPYYDEIDDANITITQMLCNGDDNAAIELEYSNSGSHIWENMNTTLYIRNNLSAGVYSVTVNDGGTCTRIIENELIQPDVLDYLLAYNDVTCFGSTDGDISLEVTGGTLPYSYTWSNGEETEDITGLGEDDYSFTITDANSCDLSGMQAIDAPEVLDISGIELDVDCNGELAGSVDITISGGVVPYVIVWNETDYVDINDDIVNAPAGDYMLTVTDDHNCSATSSFTINQPDAIEFISQDIINVLCNGDSTGEIALEIQGGNGVLSYVWEKQGEVGTYATTEDLADLPAGSYFLTITDENLCELSEDYEITESPELDVTLDITPISCAGYEDGEIMAIATGGSGTYSAHYWYDIDDNIIGVTPHVTGLSDGFYKVVVRDSYYCYDSISTTLTQAVPHVYEITPTSMSCNGLNDGQIEVIVDGGPGVGYTFDWQDAVAGNTNIAENLGEGEYFVTITDPTDCVEIMTTVIEQPYMADIGAFNDFEYLCYGNTLVLNPGTFVDYDWSTGSTDPTITVENEDVYFIEVIDAGGCHLGDTVQVIITSVFQNEAINLASVNDENNVELYWEKTPGEGTASYNIYKDSGDGFELLANKPYNEVAIYEDTDVEPSSNYYSYQITSVDSCGSESEYSDSHRTCLLDVVPDDNGACWLNWGEYEGFFVVYYFIMRGTSPDNLELVDSTLYNDYNWVEMNPNPNGSYYQIMVRRIDGCSPGDGEYYDEAYSNVVFCDNYTGIVNQAVVNTNAYPNPFNDELNINLNLNIPGELNYSFVNMLGQQISEPVYINVESGEQNITIKSDLTPGIYVLRLEFADEVYNIRVVKDNF